MAYDYISMINTIVDPSSIVLLIGYWPGSGMDIEWIVIPKGSPCILGYEE